MTPQAVVLNALVKKTELNCVCLTVDGKFLRGSECVPCPPLEPAPNASVWVTRLLT